MSEREILDPRNKYGWHETAESSLARRPADDDALVEMAAKAMCAADPTLTQWDDFGERNPLKPDEYWVSPEIGRDWWRDKARAALAVYRAHDPSGGAWLIWSNEHRAWWRAKRAGYTVSLETAGRYSRDEAINICRDARSGWPEEGAPPEIPVREGDALACAVLREMDGGE